MARFKKQEVLFDFGFLIKKLGGRNHLCFKNVKGEVVIVEKRTKSIIKVTTFKKDNKIVSQFFFESGNIYEM